MTAFVNANGKSELNCCYHSVPQLNLIHFLELWCVCVLSIRCNGLALTLTLTDTLSPRNTRRNWRCNRLALPDGQQPEEFKRYRSHIDCTAVNKQKVNRGRGAVKMCNADLCGQTHVGVDRVQTACDCDAFRYFPFHRNIFQCKH